MEADAEAEDADEELEVLMFVFGRIQLPTQVTMKYSWNHF